MKEAHCRLIAVRNVHVMGENANYLVAVGNATGEDEY